MSSGRRMTILVSRKLAQLAQGDPHIYLSFADEAGNDVTSALLHWNHGAVPTLNETVDRITKATEDARVMTDERAEEILSRVKDRMDHSWGSSYGWGELEDFVLADDNPEIAQALCFTWRRDLRPGQESGFPWPSSGLVEAVEGAIGEPIWQDEAA
jgi:hypothetical protein